VTKGVYEVTCVAEVADAVRQAFALACCGEPGPVGVVVPYNLLMETAHVHSLPPAPPGVPFDADAAACALRLLSDRRLRVGICAGLGCMDHGGEVLRAAEVLQAPVATSVSGKGVIDECHPLAVGWGFGPQGTVAAEEAFRHVDVVLAIGVRFSEVSTAFYSIPQPKHVIHVDANAHNLGRVLKTDVCVHADAGLFLATLLGQADTVCRPPDNSLVSRIAAGKAADAKAHAGNYATCGVDPMQFLLALRAATCPDALVYVDVTQAEHWAAEAFTVRQPRTYFNPTDNQAMGWSVPAALGGQRAFPGRQTVAVTGDGCFLMSMVEISTAAREALPVKFFVLDDQAYHYMQSLQKAAYRRTTATILARLDYAALARGFGVGYLEIGSCADLAGGLRAALDYPGPVLVRVVADYGKRPVRWLEAARGRFIQELSTEQKVRFLARLGARAFELHPVND
jgi:acetolactate synthase-1/2/3 large subunit